MPDVRVGIEHFGNPCRDWIKLDAGNGGLGVDGLGHKTDEMPHAAGRFQNAAALESEPFDSGIHGTDNLRRRVMGIESGSAGRFPFLRFEYLRKLFSLLLPIIRWNGGEDLGHSDR